MSRSVEFHRARSTRPITRTARSGSFTTSCRAPVWSGIRGGATPIEAGDAFLFEPGQPHQLINNGSSDLVLYVVADNPIGESCHYPDSGKWLVRSPEHRVLRSDGRDYDYYDGEE